MTTRSEIGTQMVESLPVYSQDDSTIQAFLNAVGKELERIEAFLLSLQATIQPQNATNEFLRYWETFLSLPVDPPGVSDAQRLNTINAAVRRRTAGQGAGWESLLDTIMILAPWSHEENANVGGNYQPYGLRLYGITLEEADYRAGIFFEMARFISPAHLEINPAVPDGSERFRTGISSVGDEV